MSKKVQKRISVCIIVLLLVGLVSGMVAPAISAVKASSDTNAVVQNHED